MKMEECMKINYKGMKSEKYYNCQY